MVLAIDTYEHYSLQSQLRYRRVYRPAGNIYSNLKSIQIFFSTLVNGAEGYRYNVPYLPGHILKQEQGRGYMVEGIGYRVGRKQQ